MRNALDGPYSAAPLSHTLDEEFNIPDAGIGTISFPHHLIVAVLSYRLLYKVAEICIHPKSQSATAQAPQGVSNFIDGSGPIFSMYLEMATEEDNKMAENWKADVDGILIFVRLFSPLVLHTTQ